MATYVYKYARYGKGEMIAKYSGGYIYDLRGKTFESNSSIIGRTSGTYLQKSKGVGYDYTDITVKGNIAYKNNNYYLTAKNNIIYSRNNAELAEYQGNPQEALFAYAALEILSGVNAASLTKGNYSSSGSGSSGSSSSSSSSGSGSSVGGGCGTFVGIASLFLFAAAIVLLIDYYPYYTLLHIILPALIIVGIFLKRQLKDEEYEYPLSTMFIGGLKGVGYGIATIFIFAFFDMIVHKYFSFERTLLVSFDTAYTYCFLLVIVITILLNGEKKKK